MLETTLLALLRIAIEGPRVGDFDVITLWASKKHRHIRH